MARKRGTDVVRYDVRGTVVWEGQSYGLGDPLPTDIPIEQLEQWWEARQLTRVRNGIIERSPGPPPAQAADFLKRKDPDLLRQIRRFRPAVPVIQEILAMAKAQGRTLSLIESLELCLDCLMDRPTPTS